MFRRPRRNHRAPTISGNFQRPYFGVAPRRRLGRLWVWKFETPKKVDPPGGPDYSTANSK